MGVIELDGMTQKNAGMVMEFSESGEALNAKALELRRMVSHFRGAGIEGVNAAVSTAPSERDTWNEARTWPIHSRIS
jgi:methyl-accepting chemotaxis protein